MGRETGGHGSAARARGAEAAPPRRRATRPPRRHQDAGQDLQVARASSRPAGPKEADLTSVDGVSFAGLTDGPEGDGAAGAQRAQLRVRLRHGQDRRLPRRRIRTARAAPTWPSSPSTWPSRARGSARSWPPSTRSRSRGAARGPRRRARRRRRSKKVAPFAHDLRARPEGRQGHHRRVQRLPVPVLQARRADGEGMLDKYGKDVALVFMNQPLPFHDHAMDAAAAFQAAAPPEQDKAWEMHDKMFENNTALTPRRPRQVRRGDRPRRRPSSRRTGTIPRSRSEIAEDQKVGDRGRRQRDADVLHQRPRARRARSRRRRSRRSSTRRSRRPTSSSRRGRRSRTSTRS